MSSLQELSCAKAPSKSRNGSAQIYRLLPHADTAQFRMLISITPMLPPSACHPSRAKQNNTVAPHAYDNAANAHYSPISPPWASTYHSSVSFHRHTHATPRRIAARYAHGNAVNVGGDGLPLTAHIHRPRRVLHAKLCSVQVELRVRIDTLRDLRLLVLRLDGRPGEDLRRSIVRCDGHGSSIWVLSGRSCDLSFDQTWEFVLRIVHSRHIGELNGHGSEGGEVGACHFWLLVPVDLIVVPF